MKKFIKYKVLKRISKDAKNPTPRRDIQKFIWKAQKGNMIGYRLRQGYYGTGIRQWMDDELIHRISKGKYVLTKLGQQYVKNPSSIRDINTKRTIKNLRRALHLARTENLRLQACLGEIQHQINFINEPPYPS